MKFEITFHPIWADFDPNNHMRHTAYNDYAAQVRMSYLDKQGYTMDKLVSLGLGPVLFREETRFMREVRQGEDLTVDLEMLGISKDGKFWTMIHHLYKDGGKKAAEIVVEGAWISLAKRKITAPPQEITDRFMELPQSENFQIIEKPGR
jgi:acyl-CoA thioester hydrolase